MADFNQAINYVLGNEGEDSDDAADRGGCTRFGITEATAAAHGFDVRLLTLDQAKQIYRDSYWAFDGIMDQRVATKLFDMAVNFGLVTVIRMLQIVCNKVLGSSLVHDGILGPKTLGAANTCQPDILLLGLAVDSCERHARIAQDKSQLVFLRGWILRDIRFPDDRGGLNA